jgi:hypothetical protein
MPRAFVLIQSGPLYRRDAFECGLKACGCTIEGDQHVGVVRPSDVLICWNRYARGDSLAGQFEQAGAAVIVAENGYLGASENAYAKQFASVDMRPEAHLYALALNHHNGAGSWWIGAPGRWRTQGIVVSPWRQDGEHVLIVPQRGIGPAGVAMPKEWPQKTMRRLTAMTQREVRLRRHPGNSPAEKPLEADLDGAWCTVTWGSGAAIKAICAGVPVFTDWPKWIGAPAALPLSGADIEMPLRDDAAREQMLDRLSWAQHTIAEITSGEPLRRLLSLHPQARAA